jgi:hypothetical protein
MQTFRIVRLFMRDRPRTIARGLTFEQVVVHCQDKETSSSTCRLAVNKRRTRRCGPWFDSFDIEE